MDLLPDTALARADGPAETCNWKSSVDSTNGAGIQLLTDSTVAALDNVYITRDTFEVFEPTQVAGHPAVHADATTLTGCVIYTAIADYQAVATGTNLAGRKLADPCAGARRMAEMILSNLPPLR